MTPQRALDILWFLAASFALGWWLCLLGVALLGEDDR